MLSFDKGVLEKDFCEFIKDKSISLDECWAEVKDTYGTYKISSYGRLAHWTKKNNWNILKNTNKNGDYFSVILYLQDKNIHTRIHRIVSQAFIPNPLNYPCINHKDGNKQNNKVENLEWCTYKQNLLHAKNIGLWRYNHPYKCKPIYQYDLNGNFIAKFDNAQIAYKKTGVCARNILQVASKEEYNKRTHSTRKQAGGFVWKYE